MQIIKTKFNLKKITSWVLTLTMVLSLITFIKPSSIVSAKTDTSDPAKSFMVNIIKNGQVTQVHEYSIAEMQALQTSTPVYYTSIDAMPVPVGTKAQGVLLSTLINDAASKYNSDVTNYSAIKLFCTDTAPNPYRTYSKSFLYGSQRYYFPNLYSNWAMNADGDMPQPKAGALVDPVPVEPMFAVQSYQDRYMNFATSTSTAQSDLQNETMTGVETFRFCYGQTTDNVTKGDSTTSGFARWTYRVDIILPNAPTMTTSTTNNIAGQPIDLTFTDDATWRSAITGVTVNGNVIDNTKYSTAAGKITVDGSVFTAGGDYKVAVQAKGYNDAIVTQNIQGAIVATPPTLTADTTGKAAGQSVDLSFTDDATWTSAITGVTVNGNAIDSSKYSTAAGKISIDSSVFTAAGDYKIAVQAKGYGDATATQTIQTASTGKVNISAPTAGKIYYPGNTISVTGSCQNLTQITFKVTDPNANEIFTQDIDVSQGVFKPSFALSNTASYGDYTISITGTGLSSPYTQKFSVKEPNPLVISGAGVAAPVTINYSDLQKMTQINQIFSNIDDSGNYKVYATQGVKLSDILSKVTLKGTPYQYNFVGSDGAVRYVTKQDLDAARYYFQSKTSQDGKTAVEPIIALQYNGSVDYTKMTSDGCLRNFYGQLKSDEHTMGNFVKGLVEIDVLTAAPNLTADSNNTTGQSINLTFTDDVAWRSAITGITVNGNAIDSSKYSTAVGKITIDSSVFTSAGDYKIAVQAKGYSDAAVTQTIQGSQTPVTGQPIYTITPVKDDNVYQIGSESGITTLTVKSGVSGLRYFSANITPVKTHPGSETVVFAKYSNGVLTSLNATVADFDAVSSAQAGFNVQEGDVVKVYVVDQLTNDTNVNPVVFQQ